MGIKGHLIVNPMAPVKVWKRDHLDETRDFNNLAEFEKWYWAPFHGEIKRGLMGINTQFLFTDILLDRIEDAKRGASIRMPKEPRAPGEKGEPRGRHQKVLVDGHVFNSVWAAFQALKLGGVKECVKFRSEVKRTGSGTYAGKLFKIEE